MAVDIEPKEAEVLNEDQIADKVFESHEELKAENENSEEKSSAPEQTTDTEVDKSDDESEDSQKTSEDSDEAKKESEGDPRDKLFRKAYNEAKAKFEKELETLKSQVVDGEKLKEFERVTSSPEYVRASMKAQGYTDDAINERLRQQGHNVLDENELVNVVYKELGVNPSQLDDNTKAILSDVVKIADVISEHKLGRTLPETLKPLQEKLMTFEAKDTAIKAVKEIKSVVEKEKILDYSTEVEPLLHKWLDENPKSSQDEFKSYFNKINHELAIQKLSTKGRKQERDEKKSGLRTSKEGNLSSIKFEKTGNFDEDADRILDAYGVK